MNKIPVYFNKNQLLFRPKYEWVLGKKIKHPETTRRAESIFNEIRKNKNLFDIRCPANIPLGVIRELHSDDLITLYNSAGLLPEGQDFYPSVFPHENRDNADPSNIFHAGHYCFDSGTPLNNRTWMASSWSAACAFEAATEVLQGNSRFAYALSRPPGHHATGKTYGGYCYLNNSACAAKLLRTKGKVVTVDIDFHHGNGTQEMFYRDSRVKTISIHGDPKRHFPYYCGYEDEIGMGPGKGYNHNIILKDGSGLTTYRNTLKNQVIPLIKEFDPKFLVICAGFDTYHLDPIGKFRLKTEDYQKVAKVFFDLDLPTVIIQEGGYYTKDLGRNVVSFLMGFLT